MITNKFLLLFLLTFTTYFILDYILNNVMLYVIGGIIGGTIGEAFKLLGIKAGLVLIGLVWMALLVGTILLLYRTNNTFLKYVLIMLIAALMYIIDMLVASTPYGNDSILENTAAISRIIVWVLILLKSLILSIIIFYKVIRK